MVDRLNETLNKMPKYNDNLQRSVYFKFEKVVEKYVKRFLSTTKGQVYNEDGQVQIYIQNAHNGRDISSVNAQEQEVLYKTNQRFKVLNKERLMINIISCWRNIMSEELKKGIPLFETTGEMVLCQDLVQVKMRNFSHFNPPEAQPQCVFFHTIVRIHLVTYSYNGYEFVSYCRKLPDIRKSNGMPACNREF